MRFSASGNDRHSSPTSKNVALTPFSLRMSRIGPLYLLGPSSNVSAMTFFPSGRGFNGTTIVSCGSTVTPLSTCLPERFPTQYSCTPSFPACLSICIEPPAMSMLSPCGTVSLLTVWSSVTSSPDVTITMPSCGIVVLSIASRRTAAPLMLTTIGLPACFSIMSPATSTRLPGCASKSPLSRSSRPNVMSTLTFMEVPFTVIGICRQCRSHIHQPPTLPPANANITRMETNAISRCRPLPRRPLSGPAPYSPYSFPRVFPARRTLSPNDSSSMYCGSFVTS